MAIHVVCPDCHARFKVSEQYAGKKGPCPKCKAEITVPLQENEVVIESPEQFGSARDAAGNLVLKPIARTETALTPVLVSGILLSVVAVLAAAFHVRVTHPDGNVSTLFKALGAVVMAPSLAFAGYTFLRDSDLEPYRSTSLILRITICATVYALLWGGYALAASFFFGDQPLESWSILFLAAPLVVIGTLTALATLDLTPTNAFFHCAFYLVTTIALRLIVRLSAF